MAWMLLLVGEACAQVSFGKATLLNDNWRFLRVDSAWNIVEKKEMKEADFDDSSWRRLSLPHDWGVEQTMSPDKGSCQGYLPGGIGWYRKELNLLELLPDQGNTTGTAKGKTGKNESNAEEVYIYFEGIYNYAEVYLNGQLLGCRPSGFASVLYRLTPYLYKEGKNLLAVRVNHSQEADSRWYTGSGINRNVWLITAPKMHLAQWGTAYRVASPSPSAKEKASPNPSEGGGNVRDMKVEVDIETASDDPSYKGGKQKVTVTLADADGKIVAKKATTIGCGEKKTVVLTVKKPQLWSIENPYLYTLTTKLENGDQSVVKAGLRTLQFDANKGFALNGKWMKVKGVCVHDDAGDLGTAVPKEVWKRRLLELKALGANAIRLSHNPHMPEFYDICDEIGLLVMDEASDEWEFPKRKWMKGWNKGRPSYEGTYTYFKDWIDRDVADMVRRDRCHPSIFLWSIGNEVDYPNDPYSHPVLNGDGDFTQPMYGGYHPDQPNAERIGKIAERLAKIVKEIDPSRPTTGALAGVVMSNATTYPQAVDVVGYNYTESRYDVDHKNYPERIIYGSENRHDLDAWLAVKNNEHIFGQFLWTGIDYLGESGTWPARGSSAGLLDLAGHRKPNGWYRASLWSETPTCYIGTYSNAGRRTGRWNGRQGNFVSSYAEDTWNYQEGQQVRVVCYTNAENAKLLLNGTPIGGEPKRDAKTNILYWDIPYTAGTLRCEADNGASYEIKTTGVPVALKIATPNQETTEKSGVRHFFIEVVDKDGNRVKNADNEVTLYVQGGRLLGMENGNIADSQVAGRQLKSRLRVHHGRLVAYIQPLPGRELMVTATTPFLEKAEMK